MSAASRAGSSDLTRASTSMNESEPLSLRVRRGALTGLPRLLNASLVPRQSRPEPISAPPRNTPGGEAALQLDSAASSRRAALTSLQRLSCGLAQPATSMTASICGNQPRRPNCSTFPGEDTEVIKVYLEAGRQEQQSVEMLTDEVSQIQEVRYCLKTLREQMAARHTNNNHKFPAYDIRVTVPVSKSSDPNSNEDRPTSEIQEQECERLREVAKQLYAQLREVEERHQEEREALQAENREYQRCLQEQTEHVQHMESKAKEQDQHTEELQRLLGNLELENSTLRDKMAVGEAELRKLREEEDKEKEKQVKLEKDLAVQKEKIHHLDDMLKSQQRKVRHMIEQLQNSRTIVQERDRVIDDLEEKVAFLEAENREMRDQVEFCLGKQALSLEKGAQIVYSKPLTPTSPGNKTLPFIKVIEIKS